MPATTTLREIHIELAERYGLGTVFLCTGTTTTLTLTTTGSPELRGPFSSKKINIGMPILITAGGTVGERTYVSNWVPSTGVITVSPAITTGATEAILYTGEVQDGDRVTEAVNRALKNRVSRRELRPLTYVPDGDLQGTTVADYWTAAANGTAAYASAQVFPAGSAADAVGQVGLNRLVQLTTSGGSSTLTGNGIRGLLTTQQRTWYFKTAIRLVSGSGTVEFKVRDNTNSADITLRVLRGNDSNTLTTTTLGDFMVCEGTLQLPATCAEIAPQLSLSATGMVAQMGPVIMFPSGAYSFPLPNRIETDEQVGNFFEASTGMGPGALYDVELSEPLTLGGLEHRIFDNGDHRTVTFNFPVIRPVWYEESVSEAAIAALTGTTTFPLDQVVRWAYFELTDRLMRDEMKKAVRDANGRLTQSVWRPIRNAAAKDAMNSPYEQQPTHVVGRR